MSNATDGHPDFPTQFKNLTGHAPFPWQEGLYKDWFRCGRFPATCNLPTGLGKTSIIAVWLIALANQDSNGAAASRIPRRLVYVVNRRTVVDQTTEEVRKYRDNLRQAGLETPLGELCAIRRSDSGSPLALSTLRGQFADNREWSGDPARPAVIVGTVDMIGSRLLFSGYGVGFKGKPLHAGFLGQDVLLVHDEAHLEPAFQLLLNEVEREQKRCGEFGTFRVMELSATTRGDESSFVLTDEERNPPQTLPERPTEPIHFAWRRQKAPKAIRLQTNVDEKKLADEVADLALKFKGSKRAILVFLRKVEDVEKVVAKLQGAKQPTQQLTGTLRGLERDEFTEDAIFRRFLPGATSDDRTVFLVCTSAGEVGVNISADHLVCDLSTFDSMAQRFGRVNRFGDRDDSTIHVAFSNDFDKDDELDQRRKKTLILLKSLNGDGSPKALAELNADERLAAFAPTPTILPTSDILFDAWSLTTIRGKLPGRPPVEPYLHGISAWEPPETHVAWREEVAIISGDLLGKYEPTELLEDFPLKAHELLRDNSSRVFDRLKKLKAVPGTSVWLVSEDGLVEVTTLQDLIDSGRENLSFKTVILPPSAGGLEGGLLTEDSTSANDVADEWYDGDRRQCRIRLWESDSRLDQMRRTMRLIRTIDMRLDVDDADYDSTDRRIWYWYESLDTNDSDGSKTNRLPVEWQVHTYDVTTTVERIVAKVLPGDERKDLRAAIILAARFHDLGKRRLLWQRSIGNPNPTNWLAKSGGKMKPLELGDSYRHEFGSLVDVNVARRSASAELQQSILEFNALNDDMQDVVLHLIAAHHGFGRPHFPTDYAFDPEPKGINIECLATEVPQRFARLQRKYGRWGLAYLESLLRAADYAASANPSKFMEDVQ